MNILVLNPGQTRKVKFHFPAALALAKERRVEAMCVMPGESTSRLFPCPRDCRSTQQMRPASPVSEELQWALLAALQ